MKVMRRLERTYKNKRSGSSRANWISAQRDDGKTVDLKKNNYWKNKIDSQRQDPRDL